MDFDCDRRSFLKYTGLGLAAVSFAGTAGLITNANAATNINMRSEEIETDVLVIGSGLAGTSAAVGAKKKGVDVLVVEKGKACYSGQSPFVARIATWIEKRIKTSGSMTCRMLRNI